MRTTSGLPACLLPLVAAAFLVIAHVPGPARAAAAVAADSRPFELMDVFELEHAADPQVAPDGRRVVYVRRSFDVMADRARSRLWTVAADGSDHRPLTTADRDESSPRFSPDGGRLAFVAAVDGRAQLFVRWLDSGLAAPVTQLTESPSALAWSPDGRWLAFAMHVPAAAESWVKLPPAPEGARWAEKPRVIERMIYRRDGGGYVEDGNRQLFVVPAEGGTPRQLTRGPFDHRGPLSFSPDGAELYFSANRRDDADFEPNDSEVHAVTLADGSLRTLTTRYGPDTTPVVSPRGDWIAFVGFDDRHLGFQVRRLQVMRPDGSDVRVLTAGLDRSVSTPRWTSDGRGIVVSYRDHGVGRLARVSLSGRVTEIARDVGGTTLGRPYASGDFAVGPDGLLVYTWTDPYHPADLVLLRGNASAPVRLTRLNDDLLARRDLAPVEEIRFRSSHDGREIQGWIAKPPGFDPRQKHPLLLEIHGGPFADYGPRFSAEVQLYAAAGHVVLYLNPRGSTSYGEEFANLIHHAYPGNDHDDLMSGVDAVIARGGIDTERLFVTGGSGGGVLTAWIVGKTDRFRAAVVAKPVINWYSFALTADAYNVFHRYWFPGPPWEHPEEYLRRSPISLVGNVSTPTMLLTGERDLRTPMSESEQYYQALKLRGVETALVRIPEASHGIARRPSQLVAKVAHVLAWLQRHSPDEDAAGASDEAGGG